MDEISKVLKEYGDTVGRLYLTLYHSYFSATFHFTVGNDTQGLSDYNNRFELYVKNQYGLQLFDQYKQFAKENETNLQLRNELQERQAEFTNIDVFLLAKGRESAEKSSGTIPERVDVFHDQDGPYNRVRHGSVSIKGMKADYDYDEPDKAVLIVKAATFLRPHDADNWCALGHLYIEKKEWKKAIDCYEKALINSPKSAKAHSGIKYAEQFFDW